MADFFEKYGITDEARASIILNTFMYIDKCPETEGRNTLGSIVKQMSYDGLEDFQKSALWIMKKTLEKNTDLADLELITFSENMGGQFKGAYAAAFRNSDSSVVYVVFRGTGSGRWYDNGEGLASVSSDYQKVAVWYFNDVIKLLNEKTPEKLIVTGHSKGGNLAQYVTFKSKYRSKVTRCISFDGQGFSPEFYSELNCTEDEKNAICDKMYSICGDNDYVNVLGMKIIPNMHTIYIKTKTEWKDMYGAHSIVPKLFTDVQEHYCDFLYDFSADRFNTQTLDQRDMARCSKELSAKIMELSQNNREDICETAMTLAEKFLGGTGSPQGINGEMATLEEGVGFLSNILEVVGPVTTYAGKTTLEDMILKNFILANDKNADAEKVMSSTSSKMSYIMSDPDITKMFYLVSSLAIDSCASTFSSAISGIGKLMTSRGRAEIFSFIGAQLNVSEKVAGLIDTAKDKVDSALNNYFAGNSSREDQSSKNETVEGNWDNFCGYKKSDGRNVINGTEGVDYIIGEAGNDIIYGLSSGDNIHGGDGDDEVYGGAGDDKLFGNSGNDALFGEAGNDTLSGGKGNDVLRGGSENDTYVFMKDCGNDVVYDNEGDNVLEFRDIAPAQLDAVMANSDDLLIKVKGTSDSVTIKNYPLCKNRFTLLISGIKYRIAENCGNYSFVKI